MKHIPVLEKEIVEAFSYLGRHNDGYFVDATLGNAGHSIALAKDYPIKVLAVDKDLTAINLAKENVEKSGLSKKFIVVHDDFKNIEDILKSNGIEEINGALIDLGVSSMQLDDKNRGFSFSSPEAPLDMRMDQTQELSAKEVLNHYSEEQLQKILFEYGEEQFGRSIAKNICLTRKNHAILTVGDLLYILDKAIPERIKHRQGKHYATKTFQAIRIEVNKELTGLEESIKTLIDRLAPGSRLAIISFHSLEDRIVKNMFKELSLDCICPEKAPICVCNHKAMAKIVTKKPVISSAEEVSRNPRSRSAKLRIIEKIK